MNHATTPHAPHNHSRKPAHAYTPPAGETLEPPHTDIMECGAAISTNSMERFVHAFEKSARRWEMIVYPAMFAFVVLAAYGFFLIYSLSQDMRIIASRFDPNMGGHMAELATNIRDLNQNISLMTQRMDTISVTMTDMSQKLDTLNPMLTRLSDMERTMRVMTVTSDQMRKDMSTMTQSFARPMNMINRMTPW